VRTITRVWNRRHSTMTPAIDWRAVCRTAGFVSAIGLIVILLALLVLSNFRVLGEASRLASSAYFVLSGATAVSIFFLTL
jgi:hypothetical protein